MVLLKRMIGLTLENVVIVTLENIDQLVMCRDALKNIASGLLDFRTKKEVLFSQQVATLTEERDAGTAKRCNTSQYAATRCNTLQHAATRCNTLQHAATRCNCRRADGGVVCRFARESMEVL